VNSISTGRIGHAFIFSGPRGVGKTTSARVLAKALNCQDRSSPEPCNVCSFCKDIAAGRCIDVLEIDGASNRGIDDVRELRENAAYSPSAARFKIFIIDEFHMMTRDAFNALLKTLEEPPPHIKFILATTEIHKVPVTILSRCQRYEFRRVNQKDIAGALRRIADAEQMSVSETSLRMIARMADGSMRDAQSLMDQIIAYCGMEIRDEDVQGMLGRLDPEVIQGMLSGFLNGEPALALNALSRYADAGGDLLRLLPELTSEIHALIMVKSLPDPSAVLDREPADIAQLREQIANVDLDQLTMLFEALVRAEPELRTATQPRVLLDFYMVQLARMRQLLPVSEVVRYIRGQAPPEGHSDLRPPPAGPRTTPPIQPGGPVRTPVTPGGQPSRGPAGPAPSTPGTGSWNAPSRPVKASVQSEVLLEDSAGAPGIISAPPQNAPAPQQAVAIAPEPAVAGGAPVPAAVDRSTAGGHEPSAVAPYPLDRFAQVLSSGLNQRSELTVFEHCSPVRTGPAAVELVFDEQNAQIFLATAVKPENIRLLTELLRRESGAPDLQVTVRTGRRIGQSAAEARDERKQKERERIERTALSEPAVQHAIQLFNAQVVSITPREIE